MKESKDFQNANIFTREHNYLCKITKISLQENTKVLRKNANMFVKEHKYFYKGTLKF